MLDLAGEFVQQSGIYRNGGLASLCLWRLNSKCENKLLSDPFVCSDTHDKYIQNALSEYLRFSHFQPIGWRSSVRPKVKRFGLKPVRPRTGQQRYLISKYVSVYVNI